MHLMITYPIFDTLRACLFSPAGGLALFLYKKHFYK